MTPPGPPLFVQPVHPPPPHTLRPRKVYLELIRLIAAHLSIFSISISTHLSTHQLIGITSAQCPPGPPHTQKSTHAYLLLQATTQHTHTSSLFLHNPGLTERSKLAILMKVSPDSFPPSIILSLLSNPRLPHISPGPPRQYISLYFIAFRGHYIYYHKTHTHNVQHRLIPVNSTKPPSPFTSVSVSISKRILPQQEMVPKNVKGF